MSRFWRTEACGGSTLAGDDDNAIIIITILEMAGLPLRPQQHVDGVSYRRALEGDASPRAPIFCNKWMAREALAGKANVAELAERIKKQGKVVIWRETTPVPKGAAGRVPGDASRYNASAGLLHSLLGWRPTPLRLQEPPGRRP